MSPPPASLVREWAIIAVLTVAGAVLRFWDAGQLGLNHYDEGVYALAGLWVISPTGLASLSSEALAIAPPGFSILVGACYRLFGIWDTSAILVSVVAGTLTIPVVAWLGRRAFGPGAGVAAAAFAAGSGAHVVFSRMALADVTFLLFFLVAIGLGARFLERPGLGRALALGVAVGLAQNVMYNGWLAGAIVLLTALTTPLFERDHSRKDLAVTFGFGAIAAVVAAILCVPSLLLARAKSVGIAVLTEPYRAGPLTPSSWAWHWRSQLDQATALAGSLFETRVNWGFVAAIVAFVGAFIAIWGRRIFAGLDRWAWFRFRVGTLVAAVVLGGSGEAAWWAALASVPWLLRDRRVSARLIGVLWMTFSILTPLAPPHARLWLPVHAANWLALAGLAVSLLASEPSGNAGDLRWKVLVLALAWPLVSALAIRPERPSIRVVAPTTEVRSHCQRLGGYLLTYPRFPEIRILGRPCWTFYLARDIEAHQRALGSAPPFGEPVVRSVADRAALWAPATRAVKLAFLDQAVLPKDTPLRQIEAECPEEWREPLNPLSGVSTPLATLLDLRPELASEPDLTVYYSFWPFSPKRP